MIKSKFFATLLTGAACTAVLMSNAWARNFNIPGGDMERVLDAYTTQTGISLIVSDAQVKGVRSKGVSGNLPDDVALLHLLEGTGFVVHPHSGGAIGIVPGPQADNAPTAEIELAQNAATRTLEIVTVTSSKIGGDVQNIPISITAMSQEQLTATQTAGGPDLVKNVPNLTFSKTNFSGYNLQIRGIGTQAVSVTTDPAVAVAFNDIPFIRNHFFEQEFYDVAQVEVLRGPQGTLYGRNATAGVVNLTSAKPSDQWKATASVDVGNYGNRRLEGMLNLPIIGDKLDMRVAGEWTKRDGYTFDTTTDKSIDGRDLWSGRVSVGFKPIEKLEVNVVWEHFSEDDDRLRSGKTLCNTDHGPSSVDGPDGLVTNIDVAGRGWLSQGCLPGSLYGRSSFGQPNFIAVPFIGASEFYFLVMNPGFNPSLTEQAPSLRTISSSLEPSYRARNDTLEFNVDYRITPSLTVTSQTGYNKDFLYSTEDYNRFASAPGAFRISDVNGSANVGTDDEICDPQLGCSNAVLSEDVSQEHAEQFYQEVRLASNLDGPFNFSAGASYLHYQTIEDYYVFYNVITALAEHLNGFAPPAPRSPHVSFDPTQANACGPLTATTDPDFSISSMRVSVAWGAATLIPIRSVRSTDKGTIISVARIPIGCILGQALVKRIIKSLQA